MVFLQFESIWVSLGTRSGQGNVKNSNFEMFNFDKNDPRIPMVQFFSVRGLEPPKNQV